VGTTILGAATGGALGAAGGATGFAAGELADVAIGFFSIAGGGAAGPAGATGAVGVGCCLLIMAFSTSPGLEI
jgi:hypothetical protein